LDLAAAALLIALVVVPAYFNIQSSTSFEPDKSALLRSLLVIALAALLPDVVQRLRSPRSKPNWSGIRLPVALLAGVVAAVVLSSLLGVDFVTSFWGNYERGYGLLSVLVGVVVVIVAYRMARSGQQSLLIDAVLLAAAAPAFYALAQVVGYDPVIGQTVSFELGRRASATLGNPLFLANFMLLAIPLGLARIAIGPPLSSRVRALLGAYLVVLVLALIATQSLTALGAGLTAGAFFMVAYGKRQDRFSFRIAGLGILLSGFLLLLAAWLAPQLLPARLGDIFASGGSGGQRLLFWEAILRLLQQEPRWLLTGLGPDALPLKIAPYLSPQVAHFEVDWAFRLPDRAHTLSLDLLSAGGVLALSLWLLFWIALVARLLPAFPNRPGVSLAILAGGTIGGAALGGFVGLAAIPIGLTVGFLGGVLLLLWLGSTVSGEGSQLAAPAPYLLAALVGHWVYLAFGFATHAPDLLVWVTIGLILGWPLVGARKTTRQTKTPPGKTAPTLQFLLAGIAFAAFAFSVSAAWPASLPLWIGASALLLALAFALSPAWDRAKWLLAFVPTLVLAPALILNRTVGLPAWLAYTWLLLWLLAMVWLLLPGKARRRKWLPVALLFPVLVALNLPIYGDIAYKSALLNPYDAETRTVFMDRALLLSPYDHVLAAGMAAVEQQLASPTDGLDSADSQRISALYQHAMSAQPLAPEPVAAYAEWLRQRSQHDPAAAPLAYQVFERTLALSPNDIETRNRLALHRWQSGDVEVAINELETLLLVDPLYGPTYLNLATIQHAQGDVLAAEATLEAGVARVPWWPDLPQALEKYRRGTTSAPLVWLQTGRQTTPAKKCGRWSQSPRPC